MKRLTLLLVLVCMTTLVNAQDRAYKKSMENALSQLEKAHNATDFQKAGDSFSKIADNAHDSYLPPYYAAYSRVIESFMLKDKTKRDNILDEAKSYVDSAKELSSENSEIIAMEGFVLMAKMVIDPQSRAPQTSESIMNSFEKAHKISKNNPRPVLLKARMELGTSEYFGSTSEKACELAKKGEELLSKENPKEFEPHWGEHIAQDILENCAN